jgi:hypothetical protein
MADELKKMVWFLVIIAIAAALLGIGYTYLTDHQAKTTDTDHSSTYCFTNPCYIGCNQSCGGGFGCGFDCYQKCQCEMTEGNISNKGP